MKKYLIICVAGLFLALAPALHLGAQTNEAAAQGTAPAEESTAVISEDLPVSTAEANKTGPSVLTAAEEPVGPSSHTMGLDIAKAVGGFLLILALLFICLKALSRVGRFKRLKGPAADFEMRGTLALDSRKYLAAVAIDGRLLILGVTQDKISALAHWPLSQDDDQAEEKAFKLPDQPEDDSDHAPDISIAGD